MFLYLPQIFFYPELVGLLYLPRKKNDLRPNTKLLLSVKIKASAEHQGPIKTIGSPPKSRDTIS